MKRTKYTEEDVISAVKQSVSIRQVLNMLNLKPAGGNYNTIHKTISKLKLDTSHFTGSGWNKGKQQPLKRKLEDYLENKKPICSFKLKNRLLREGVFTRKCCCCNLSTWQEQPIPLELDHIDGNKNNNNLSNLRLLCPNCHALTPTYRGKNIGKIVPPMELN